MYKFKFKISSESKIIDKQGVIEQDGFNSFLLVPFSNKGDFQEKFDAAYQIKSNSIVQQLDTINQEANNIKNQVLGLSTNLEENYLSEANLYNEQQLITLASAIKESTATFVTTEQAGQWYGLELVTDVNGKKYVTGFDAGAIVYPETGNSNSYFRINADRFIVGGDLGDGSFTTMVGQDGEPIPAFAIVQDGTGPAEMYFNGKVNIAAIPSQINKFIGNFPNKAALDVYLAGHPDVVVNSGDTYRDTTKDSVYMWTGTDWTSNGVELVVRSMVFKRGNTIPATPTGGDYDNTVPDGWSDGIPAGGVGTIAQEPVWSSVCSFSNKVDYTLDPPIWSTPVLAVDSSIADYMYNSSEGIPVSPLNTTDSLEAIAEDYANGWRNDADETSIWMANRNKLEGTWSSWNVIKVKGETGEQGPIGLTGAPGTSGQRGGLIATASGAAVTPSAVTLNGVITAISGSQGIVIAGDVVVWTNTLSTGVTEIYTYNGTTWGTNTALRVNGNAIVDGTIFANKIATYNLTTSNATIGTALIDTANIKDLSVDTIKIKNGAVSSIVSTTGNGVLDNGLHNSSANARDIASLSYAYTGTGSISILVDFYGLNIGASTCEIMFFLERNGSQIYFPYGSQAFRLYGPYSMSYSFNILDTPASAGTYTYTLKMYVISSSASIERASLIAIGIKK